MKPPDPGKSAGAGSGEAAPASETLRKRRSRPGYEPLFRVVEFRVSVGKSGDEEAYSEATIKLRVGERTVHTAAEGNGPVSALDTALRKALLPSYADVEDIHLADYRVHIVDGSDGTAATTHVLLDSKCDSETFTTEGISTNIIQASLDALIDSVEFALLKRLGTTLD